MKKLSIWSSSGHLYKTMDSADIELTEEHISRLITALCLIGTYYVLCYDTEKGLEQAFKASRYHNKSVKVRMASASEMINDIPNCSLLA